MYSLTHFSHSAISFPFLSFFFPFLRFHFIMVQGKHNEDQPARCTQQLLTSNQQQTTDTTTQNNQITFRDRRQMSGVSFQRNSSFMAIQSVIRYTFSVVYDCTVYFIINKALSPKKKKKKKKTPPFYGVVGVLENIIITPQIFLVCVYKKK